MSNNVTPNYSHTDAFNTWVTGDPVKPPCTSACPVNADVQKFVTLVAQGRFRESLDAVRERCTLPGSLGRICHHPCESECRRNDVEGAVNIRAVKRFAADVCKDEPHYQPVPKTKGKTVAIIGGGPAGLTAAYDLAKDGFDVTIYEKNDECGGAIYTGVPKYRLPKDIVAWDVAAIESLGVTIKRNTTVGRDIAFDDLTKQYDAVLIAIGLTLSRGIPIPGHDANGVLLALPFLQEANFNDNATVGKKVVVIGGGNVAFDVARSAKRLGAEEINLCCLECTDEIPAFSWELDEAAEEGIKINPSWGPKQITVKDGKVAGMAFKRCTRVFDENRMFSPQYNECELLEIEADNVIFAIGQGADMTGFTDTSLEVDERGRIKWSPATFQTNLTNVFACGEVVTGPGAAVAAMRNAHDAATAIETYLTTGKVESVLVIKPAPIERMPQAAIDATPHREKNAVPMLEPGVRVKSFIEAEPGFDTETGIYEAQRCMNCSRGATLTCTEDCAACLSCVRVCPYGAPYITAARVANFSWESCQACGICAAVCPGLAIDVAYNTDTRINEQIDAGTSGITVIGCQYAVPSVQNPSSLATPQPDGLNFVKLMCTSRLDTRHLLRAIENGTDGIAVLACPDEECRHRRGVNWAQMRVNEVKIILEAAGIGADRLVFMGAPESTEALGRALGEFKEKLAELGPNPIAKVLAVD
ncbi:MAG TPA: FAD-dependent oxidoreductase [Candidatus Aquicultor sp.]|jgi:NADPH-dependent glutamate synthase beta subunit-like oxidoreductase/coenzyme F420-reducing hydrogenase delta subunit